MNVQIETTCRCIRCRVMANTPPRYSLHAFGPKISLDEELSLELQFIWTFMPQRDLNHCLVAHIPEILLQTLLYKM